MIDPQTFDQIAQKLTQLVPEPLGALRADFEKNVRGILEAALAKCDVVPRTEFDAQVGVLERTRAQLTELEVRVKILENK